MKYEDSLLIIGAGTTEYRLNEIYKVDSEILVKKYGTDSELYTEYTNAKAFGARNIYLMNMLYQDNYPEVIHSFIQNDFTYIAPINITFSQKIYNPETQKFVFPADYFLKKIKDNNYSTIIMTDAHASLYEDIDSFIDSTEEKIRAFKNTCKTSLKYGRNLCFIANNLKDYQHANVIIAATLLSTPYNAYPSKNFGDTIFDIDYHDVKQKEFCFFKYNTLRSTTIENFNNFSYIDDQDKFIPINRCIKYVQRNLDISEFCGRMYNDYLKIAITNKLNNLLEKMRGTILHDYKVESCEFYKNKTTNTVTVVNTIVITPINSLEKYKLTLEI